jgi:hypothetical protein
MAIVFEANYSKKLGLPGYSSHQYQVTVRVEMADITQVPQESERLYGLLQSCVDREIQQTGFLPVNGYNAHNGSNGNGSSPTNGNHFVKANPQGQSQSNGINGNNGIDVWKCTPKQRELILKVVDENQIDKKEIEALAKERFNTPVKCLNTLQASGLIQELLQKYPGKDQGNGNRLNGGNRLNIGRGTR